MPVESTDNRVQYDTNGTTGPWTITFYFLANADVRVVYADADGNETALTLDVDYTLTGAGVETGGTCTTTTAYASGGTITILRDLDALQPEEFTDGDAFPAAALNRGLDRATMLLQQFEEVIGRALVIPESENNDMTLPAAATRASKVLAFDADGTPVAIVGVDAGSAAALELDLRSTASDTKGASILGYDPTLAYASGLGLFLNNLYARTAAEVTAGVTPTYYYYPPGDVRRYGAVLDGVTDDTAALQRWASVDQPRFGRRGTAKVSGQITFAANTLNIDGGGMVIDASAGGTFTDLSVIYCTGSLTQIADLSVSPAAKARSLTFGSAHGRTAGDVCIIYNPTDYSWNTSYTYSRAGEFFRVAYVSSTTALKTDNPLHAGYTAANVDVYVMAKNEVNIQNLTVVAPDTGNIRPFRLRLATKVTIRDVSASGSNVIQIDLDRCYAVRIDGVHIDNRKQVIAATYGLSIGNSQHVTVSGSQINATRHAVNIGGDDLTGSVPNRDINIEGCTLRNDAAFTSVPCADIHANCEGVTYRGNRIYGGGSLNGKDCAYIDNTFEECDVNVGAMLQGGSQWVGGYAKVIGNTFIAGGLYAYGLIRLFVDTTNTNHDSHLIVRDNVVSMSTCDVLCRVENSDPTLKANVHVSGITFLDASALSNVVRMVGTGVGDYAVVDDIRNGKVGAQLFVETGGYSVSKVSLQEQRGTATITPVSGAATASAASQTFRYSYGSRTPVCTVSLASGTVNSKTVIGYPSSVSATAIIPTMRTADSTTMGVTSPDVTAYWTASVNEI